MKIKKPFAEMDEDEYLFGKLTSDGSDVHLFFEEQHLPKGKKRRKIPEKRVDVDISDLELEKMKEENYEGIIIEECAVETGKNKVLQEIIKTINENYSNLKTLEDLCDLVHFSPSYIYRLFKKHLNTTPHHYISVKKLLKAKELLSSDKEIVDVCYESGFSDCEYFITVFKKTFGVTPYRYKKSEINSKIKKNQGNYL